MIKIDVFAKCAQDGDYDLILSYTDDEDAVISSQIIMPQNESYGGLNKTTITVNNLDITKEMSLSLTTDEVEDMFLVFHYKLDDES